MEAQQALNDELTSQHPSGFVASKELQKLPSTAFAENCSWHTVVFQVLFKTALNLMIAAVRLLELHIGTKNCGRGDLESLPNPSEGTSNCRALAAKSKSTRDRIGSYEVQSTVEGYRVAG